MSDRPTNANTDEGGQLFQNMDEQERTFAPEQVPDADMPEAEVDRGGTAASNQALSGDQADTPVAVPAGPGGGAAPTAPPSDAFEPGVERERRDVEEGDAGIVGPDTRDERVKLASSATQQRERRP